MPWKLVPRKVGRRLVMVPRLISTSFSVAKDISSSKYDGVGSIPSERAETSPWAMA